MKKIKVFIVDDHPMMRFGLSKFFESKQDIQLCGEADSINKALSLITKAKPEVVIVDLAFNDEMDGLELIKNLKKRYPKISSLVLSMYDERIYAERSIKAGAKGYMQKNENPEKILTAVRDVANNNIYLNNYIKDEIIKNLLQNSVITYNKIGINSLSNKEFEIFRLLGNGLTIKEIAKKINLNNQTVETHRRSIKKKLSISTNPLLIKYAVEWLALQTCKDIS